MRNQSNPSALYRSQTPDQRQRKQNLPEADLRKRHRWAKVVELSSLLQTLHIENHARRTSKLLIFANRGCLYAPPVG